MSQNIEVIYENGVLRPLQPLNLPEKKIFKVNVPDEAPSDEETHRDKVSRVLREAGLTSQMKFPNAKKLSDEERRRIGKLFSGEKSLGEYIDEDREARG
ncbi:MAG: antitoxin family protein [Acidobacteriota bacterium]|jgi:predicted DNA-binding antitoxin AbrB/MazE fold protein|nr:antitoxin family protein [Acidobacteriota bacterium]